MKGREAATCWDGEAFVVTLYSYSAIVGQQEFASLGPQVLAYIEEWAKNGKVTL